MRNKKNKEEVKVALESGIYTFDIPVRKSEFVEMIYKAYRLGWSDRSESLKRILGR